MEQLTKNQADDNSKEYVQKHNEPQLHEENPHNEKYLQALLNNNNQSNNDNNMDFVCYTFHKFLIINNININTEFDHRL